MFQIKATNTVELYKNPGDENPEKVIPVDSYIDLMSVEDEYPENPDSSCWYKVKYTTLRVDDIYYIKVFFGVQGKVL